MDFKENFGPLFSDLKKEKNKKEKKAIKHYEKALKIFEGAIGNDVTYNTTLHKVGKHVWGKKFAGVYSSNSKIPPESYSICNVDEKNEPGSHWLAICDNIIYDSFGRKITKLSKHLSRFKDIVDNDAEQIAKENNCGARCLAWIHVYHTLGEEYAILI